MAGKLLIKNSLVGIIQFVLTAILTLISVPVFIHQLGMELYGIFAIISVIGNLNLLANFGLNGALLVYIAKQGKCRESDHDIIVTQIIMIILTLVFAMLAIIFCDFIIQKMFSIPARFVPEAKNLLIYLVFANSLLLLGQTYSAILDAKQKIYISNICQFIYSLIYWGGMIIAVSMGGQLTMIGMIALLSAIAWFLLVMISSRRIWGKLEFNGVITGFKVTAKKQLKYGSKIYISGLAGLMFEPLSKILLSNFVGLNAVALFEIGSKIRGQISGILTKALYPVYPYIANTPKSVLLNKKLFDFSKFIQLIVIPLSIVLAFVMTVLLKLWLNPVDLFQTSVFVITMSVSFLFFLPPVLIIYQYLAAKNMADRNIWVQLSSGIVNVVIFFALLNKFGIYSILFSNTIALISSYFLCYYFQFKYLGANFKEEMPFYIKLLIFTLICTLTCVFVRYFLPIGLWELVIYPIVIGFMFLLFVRLQKLVSDDDLELYFGSMPFLRSSLTRLLIA